MTFSPVLTAAHARIAPYIHRTPVLQSGLLNEIAGIELFFKCDNFQKGGSYKIRGALNCALQLSEEEKTRGITTHSSGNFAQAVALSAKLLGIPAHIAMPSNAPQVKVDAVRDYGGRIITCGSTPMAREAAAEEIIKETGATFLHPSNNLKLIHGHSSAGIEMLEEQPQLDAIFAPVGGGGLIAGTCLAAAGTCEVFGAEPFEADDAWRSLQSGKIESNETTNTIADGLRTQLGDINFPIIQEHIKAIVRVTEEEIVEAMKLVWTRMKIIIEPSSAVTFAAVLKDRDRWQGKKVGIIVSGGNVDVEKLPF